MLSANKVWLCLITKYGQSRSDEYVKRAFLKTSFFLTRFNKIAIQGTPQMAVD